MNDDKLAAPAQHVEEETVSKGMSRRTFVKGAVAAAGIAGFPYVHAQEKITLRYLARPSTRARRSQRSSRQTRASRFNTSP